MTGTQWLLLGATFSFVAALAHIATIIGGPDWYRFFGAGEHMAQLAAQGSHKPTLITLFIAAILALWGGYALAGAGLIPALPLLKTGLVVITGIYLLRAVAGFVLPFITRHPAIMENSITFWMVSSTICLLIGLTYLIGTLGRWSQLS